MKIGGYFPWTHCTSRRVKEDWNRRHADAAIQGRQQQHRPSCDDCLRERVCRRIQVSCAGCYEVPRTWKCPQQQVHNVLHRRPQEIRRCPPGRVSLCSYLIYIRSFATFTSRRLQPHEKKVRRQGHSCLRFFHDFVSAVLKARTSCGWRHFSPRNELQYRHNTAMRPLRGQNLRSSKTAEIRFDLYSIKSYIWRTQCLQYKGIQLGHPGSPFMVMIMIYCIPFVQFQYRSESPALLRFGLPGGTVASVYTFLAPKQGGVPLFGEALFFFLSRYKLSTLNYYSTSYTVLVR